MGSFKGKSMENVQEMRERSRETTDLGREMQEDAEKINHLLDSISLLDDEDMAELGKAKDSYQGSFDCAYSDQVETSGKEISERGDQIRSEVGAELENVRDGSKTMDQARGVSEIGREAAEAGKESLERSGKEYEDISADAERVTDETGKEVERLKSEVSRIFG